jgi:hypothetical protein
MWSISLALIQCSRLSGNCVKQFRENLKIFLRQRSNEGLTGEEGYLALNGSSFVCPVAVGRSWATRVGRVFDRSCFS